MMFILNGTVFLNGKLEKKDIRVEAGKFTEIAEAGELCVGELCLEEEVLDAAGKYIIPGLVDVHTHGRSGKDFSKITGEDLPVLLESYARCGVTSVVGTTMTNDPQMVEASLRIMGEYRGDHLLGIHMEGPFLGTGKKGAHDANYLELPDWSRFEKMRKISGGIVRLVTLDPGLDGAEEFIKECVKNGIKVSLGHTDCTYETAVKARQWGADHVTHVFNGMGPLHHREPGVIGAAMDTGMYTELICDGIHVHPAVVRLLFAAHPEQMVLISDSVSPAGMPDGEYESGGLTVVVKDGKAVLPDGTIAGSVISLFDAMTNAIRFGVPAEQAINSATYLPAKSVGAEQIAGSIAVGRKAEFLVVDREWNLEKVFMVRTTQI